MLEMDNHDYSLTKIASIVESNNSKILSSYIISKHNSNNIEVTLKINKQDITNIIKDFESKIHAHFNVCRHRGTRICNENNGKFSKSIQCGYHGWTYALDGKLVGAPHMNSVENFNKDDSL